MLSSKLSATPRLAVKGRSSAVPRSTHVISYARGKALAAPLVILSYHSSFFHIILSCGKESMLFNYDSVPGNVIKR